MKKVCIPISILFFIFASCASWPSMPSIKTPAKAPPPQASVGPEMVLMAVSVKDGFKAVMDNDGRGHILVARSKPRELYHLIVDQEGVSEEKIIRRSGSFENLDIAFDRRGQLHAIIDEDHLVLKEGTWQLFTEHQCRQFAQNGNTLVCAYNVKGDEIDAPGRWDWYFIAEGGYGVGCCLIFPWHTKAKKMVIAAETEGGWSKGVIIDSGSKMDIIPSSLSADESGTIHIVYTGIAGGNLNERRDGAYLAIDHSTIEQSGDRGYFGGSSDLPKKIPQLVGQKIDRLVSAHTTADQATGALLVVTKDYSRNYKTRAIVNGVPGQETDFFSCRHSGIYIASAAEGRFHALVIDPGTAVFPSQWFVNYMLYHNERWSAPMVIGGCLPHVQLISDRSGRALAIWQTKDKELVARWIEVAN